MDTNELPKDINDVKKKINELTSFHDLEVEYYAVENGAACIIAEKINDKVTQLRKFFHKIKNMDIKLKCRRNEEPLVYTEIALLLPELAYAKGRNLISPDFYDIMKSSLQKEKLKTVGDFKKLVSFLSAILAYQKRKKQ
jgi:CRISPR-associated protein Csm2